MENYHIIYLELLVYWQDIEVPKLFKIFTSRITFIGFIEDPFNGSLLYFGKLVHLCLITGSPDGRAVFKK